MSDAVAKSPRFTLADAMILIASIMDIVVSLRMVAPRKRFEGEDRTHSGISLNSYLYPHASFLENSCFPVRRAGCAGRALTRPAQPALHF